MEELVSFKQPSKPEKSASCMSLESLGDLSKGSKKLQPMNSVVITRVNGASFNQMPTHHDVKEFPTVSNMVMHAVQEALKDKSADDEIDLKAVLTPTKGHRRCLINSLNRRASLSPRLDMLEAIEEEKPRSSEKRRKLRDHKRNPVIFENVPRRNTLDTF